ncbi:LOW QUALITY PROTEIN: hypothetical protein PFNF135_02520 [Plasmodium falciparum NF135/5.C10]|uniref:Uncharacterized protein n=1 Tax=Plasmodium falciparum NF135/5.C10 TaxID=1036726 RepID=W4IIW6_PLAFA|nr:LOW QUALITY PROTEIN: hypothetical protein PFNF135_02520 [Plasmodium falciparum NF135/5.C10]
MYIILLNCLIKSDFYNIPLNMIYIYIYYIYFKLYKNIFVYNIMFFLENSRMPSNNYFSPLSNLIEQNIDKL